MASIAARCRCAQHSEPSLPTGQSPSPPAIIEPISNYRVRPFAQILNAVPGSASQTWHADNRTRGLTIIVPLVDFTADNGATQVLPCSHTKAWPLVAQSGARVVQAPVGGIAAFDSRTFHRGLGNESHEGRPALIFCYDREWSPPPGVGVYGSIANAYLAGLLNIASAGWLTCASVWKEAS